MSAKVEIYEVTFSAGDWEYPIYFSLNSAAYWQNHHAADYIEPKSSIKDAVQQFKDYLRSEWNLPQVEIAATAPKLVSAEVAAQNSPGKLNERSGGAFIRAPKL